MSPENQIQPCSKCGCSTGHPSGVCVLCQPDWPNSAPSDTAAARALHAALWDKHFNEGVILDPEEIAAILARHHSPDPERDRVLAEVEWQPIETIPNDDKKGPFLVTNNLNARDAHGRMSHLWLVTKVYGTPENRCAFIDLAGNKVQNLTHWVPALRARKGEVKSVNGYSVGDSITTEGKAGKVIGFSRDKTCARVVLDGQSSEQVIHFDEISPAAPPNEK